MIVKAGSNNVSVYYYIVQDASGTSPGEPVTGLLFSDIETGGSASFVRQGADRTDLTLITLASASATHADGGFILVDDTNMPGLYRCDYPDAAFATGIDQVFLQIVVASANNAVAAPILVDIDDNVDQTGDSFARIGVAGAGLTNINLPNQTMDIVGDITGNLSGSVGSVTAIDTTAGAIDNVVAVAVTDTNSDMRGTDSALLAASINLTAGAVDNVTTVATTTTNTDMRGTDSALLAANINLTGGAIDNVTLVATTTTNTDMRGTDSALLAASINLTGGAVDNVTLVATTTTNTDMVAQPTTLLTTQMTESYAADGVAPTVAQALFIIQQFLQEHASAGTTKTVKRIDGSTTAATYTYDDGTNPTSLTRTT